MALQYDPDVALKTLAAADPVLARLFQTHGPFALEVRDLHDVFQTLLRTIAFQQLSTKAASTIFGRVEALFSGPITPEDLLETPDEALRGAGLSRAKTAAAKDLAAKTLDGTVPPLNVLKTLGDEEVIERLTAVRGIGPWTVQMLLMFRLGRPDVLPTSDLGIRKGFMRAYGLEALPAPKALRQHAESWRPYRSVACWYLWRLIDSDDAW